MGYFLCKLIPPRPSFARDVASSETAFMRAHAYWTERAGKGRVAVLGPAADRHGVRGLGSLEAASEAEAHVPACDDAVARAGAGCRYEIFAMPRLSIRRERGRAPRAFAAASQEGARA